MKKQVLLLFTSLLLITACTKQGTNGPAGPIGPAGPQGSTGNANVMVDTFTLTSAQFAYHSIYDFRFSTSDANLTRYFTRYHDCPFPAATSEVLATGMILAYFIPDLRDLPNQWAPLPYSFLEPFNQYYYNFAYETNIGTVRIHFFYSANGATGNVPGTLASDVIATHRYKLVAVSGQIADAMRRSKVNLDDEAAVSRFLQ